MDRHYLTVRPELVEGRSANYDTVSKGRGRGQTGAIPSPEEIKAEVPEGQKILLFALLFFDRNQPSSQPFFVLHIYPGGKIREWGQILSPPLTGI